MKTGRALKYPKAAALVVVLSVVLLLTGLVVAFLSIALMHRRISNQSAGQAKADLLARSALSIIVGDLKREIVLGSDKDSTGSPLLYIPKTESAMLPERSGTPPGPADPIPNLIRCSVRNDSITVPSQASAVNSLNDVSVNRRSVSLSRWNAHYLVPKSDPLTDDSDPIPDFKAPDWVIVTRSGRAVKTDADVAAMRDPTSADHAIGRYAYAIYDEGGLLDMNAAGYDSSLGLSATQTGAKGSPAYARLTCLPGLSKTKSLNDLLGWRNYATLQAVGDFGKHNFTFGAVGAYSDFALNNPDDFLKARAGSWNNHTDQIFPNRQTLLALRRSLEFSANSLTCLGTFSRDLNLPTLPGVLKLRVKQGFIRRDGSGATSGESLLHRFALERLSALKIIPPTSPAEIQRDFGLVAIQGGDGHFFWAYCGVSGTNLKNGLDDSWMASGNWEPDFFELIALGIGGTPALADVLTVGAGIIDQFDGDSDITRIGYSTSTGSVQFSVGKEQVPILNRPFQSVGELRYTAGSTDDMLDLFCARLSGERVRLRAGMVNRNTRNSFTVAALLSGAYKDPGKQASNGLTDSNAIEAANKLSGIAKSRGEGLGSLQIQTGDPELASRALADVTTVRVWSLMIDIIAQSGRFVPGAKRLDQFIVEGESRYWLHIALDRFTGRILDIQSESVHE